MFIVHNMPVICEHAHRLELRQSFKFLVAVATSQVYRKPRLPVIPIFMIQDMHVWFLFLF